MSTTLFDRIARLMRAEGHGVLEALEERSLLLRQHLREAELALEEKRARVAALAGEETQLGDEIERRRTRVGELDGEVAYQLVPDAGVIFHATTPSHRVAIARFVTQTLAVPVPS